MVLRLPNLHMAGLGKGASPFMKAINDRNIFQTCPTGINGEIDMDDTKEQEKRYEVELAGQSGITFQQI